MKDDLKREIKGKMDNLKGRIREAFGTVSGNKEHEVKGAAERASGAAQEKVAEVERKVRKSIDDEEADDE
jgi:uncharacterized protein YjbJ (UPF0337 family)